MAKELSMVERNEKGKQARRYFIECEKRFLAAHREPKAIDVRTLLLTGQSDPSIPVPPVVAAAIDRKAWDMAHEAFGLCREHLLRRVAFTAEYGEPRYLCEQKALMEVSRGGIGEALAHEWLTQIDLMKTSVESYIGGIRPMITREISKVLEQLSQIEKDSFRSV